MAPKSADKSIAQLFELIDAKDRLRWEIADGPDVCVAFARTAMDQGHFALAYYLLNAGLDQFLQDPKHWSLTTLREKRIKIGAKVVRHGRYITSQMVEVTIPRTRFVAILRLIDGLRPAPLSP